MSTLCRATAVLRFARFSSRHNVDGLASDSSRESAVCRAKSARNASWSLRSS